jgi:hypothetical protein
VAGLSTNAEFPRRLAPLVVLLALVGLLLCSAFTSAATAACLPDPSACGYPDESNTGVPPGTVLTPSGSKTVSTDGAVLSGLEITGTVTVTADNVTIEDSRITRTSGGSGSYAVILNNGADNFTIEDTEVVGPISNTEGLQSAVWNHYNNPGAIARRVYFHRCADCWEGAGTFRDDYMVVDAAYSGSHDEDIYVCGTTVNVDHSTLINTHQQTATVFGDTICGGNNFTVTDSLLAGGGFVLYPQANSSSETGSTNISGNRIARCRTAAVYNPGSGGTACSGGADSFGYYPLGGYYGVAAYAYSGPDQIWTNNVWDDSSQPICDDGRPGCGVVSPPPEEPPTEEPPGEEEPPAEEPPDEEEPPAEEEPPVEEPPTEEPPGEEPPAEEEPSPPEEPEPPDTPADAVWTPPASVQVGVPVTLDGTASAGDGPLACTWSFENQSATVVWETHTGCQIPFVFEVPDTKYVKLTVTDANGDADSSRQSFTVLTGPPDPPQEPGPGTEPTPPEEPGVAAAPANSSADRPSSRMEAPSSPPPTVALRAIWHLPGQLQAGRKITLTGESPGAQQLSCFWTIKDMAGQIYRRDSGCAFTMHVPRTGTRYVRLTVHDGSGRSSSRRHAISASPQRPNRAAAL